MLHSRSILRILGNLLSITGAAMLLPMLIAAACGDASLTLAFALPAALSAAFGAVLSRSFRKADRRISLKDGLFTLALSWFAVSVIGGLPYMISGFAGSPADALFESISSFTTTGATAFEDLSGLPEALRFWRSFSQWLGGLGILVLISTLAPASYSQTDSSLQSGAPGINADNMTLRRSSAARYVYAVYPSLTLLQFLLLRAGGLSSFDALTLSFSTASSGGLSGYGAAPGFSAPYLEMVLALSMFLSCINFNVYISVIKSDADRIKKSTELRAYVGILLASAAAISLDLFLSGTFESLSASVRYGSFQTVSFMTTTGLASTDLSGWPAFSRSLLTALTFIGGCSYSTGGALKVIRVVILSKMVWRSFTTRLHPNAVVMLKTNGRTLSSKIPNAVVAYTLTYVSLFLAGAFLLSFDAKDIETAITASAAMVNNVGAALGQAGISAEYGGFSVFSKLTMSFLMLAGRLELYAVLLPLTAGFWKEKI